MQVKIKQPCSQDWENMKIGLHSRFCENCDKSVVDFSTKTRKEIIQYVLEHRGDGICARMKQSQVDIHHTDLVALIHSRKKMSSNTFFYLLSIGAILLTGCQTNTDSGKHRWRLTVDTVHIEHPAPVIEIEPEVQSQNTNRHLLDSHLWPKESRMFLGNICVVPENEPTKIRLDQPYRIVDQMPEFTGGRDSMLSYLEENINYPADNNTEGTVVATFVVDTLGNIRTVRTVARFDNSSELEEEVSRVISNMPNWIPGKHQGKKVEVMYNIPIGFKKN